MLNTEMALMPGLESVPAHWKLLRCKYVWRPVDVRSLSGDEERLTVSSASGIVPRSSKNVTMFEASTYVGHKLVEPDDLVINSLWAWAGGLGVSRHFGLVSPVYGVYRLRPEALCIPRFMDRLMRSSSLQWQFQVRSKGIWRSRLSITDESFLEVVIPVPSLEEQSLIVRYLDHAELRIAKAIAAKQRMIALLEEREELALLQAITQSDRPMTTDSRLDWLGEFPAHWEVKRLGSLLEERNEMNADRRVQQVLSLVRKRGVMRYEDKGRIGNKRSDDVARYKVVREGDIVLNSMNVIIGSVGQSAYTGCLSPVYYVLKPRSNEHHNAYFNALFQVERFHSSLVRFGKGILAHRLRIPMIDLKTVMLPVPPPDEQLAIADRVVKATAKLRAAKDGIEAEIALLREYRTRHISDVVTGKLDVRDEAAKLPDVDPMELVTVSIGENGDDEEATDDD
jgi:type I restriction enzyme S subunit